MNEMTVTVRLIGITGRPLTEELRECVALAERLKGHREAFEPINSKLSSILYILSKQTMTIEEILQKEDDAAAEVGKLVTAYQATASEVGDLQVQIVALQGTQVTDAQLQSLADKADSIKQAADMALPATSGTGAEAGAQTGA
jgi:hypothetical protein